MCCEPRRLLRLRERARRATCCSARSWTWACRSRRCAPSSASSRSRATRSRRAGCRARACRDQGRRGDRTRPSTKHRHLQPHRARRSSQLLGRSSAAVKAEVGGALPAAGRGRGGGPRHHAREGPLPRGRRGGLDRGHRGRRGRACAGCGADRFVSSPLNLGTGTRHDVARDVPGAAAGHGAARDGRAGLRRGRRRAADADRARCS